MAEAQHLIMVAEYIYEYSIIDLLASLMTHKVLKNPPACLDSPRLSWYTHSYARL